MLNNYLQKRRLWKWYTEREISDLVLIPTVPNSPQASPIESRNTTPSPGFKTDDLASKINGKVSMSGWSQRTILNNCLQKRPWSSLLASR